MAYPTTVNNQSTSWAPAQTITSANANGVGVDVNALTVKVGSGASSPVAGTVLTGTGAGTSGWQTLFQLPTATTGAGLLAATPSTVTFTGTGSLMYLDFVTHAGSGVAKGIEVRTDSDTLDSAAGIHITNIGASDAMYINVAGKVTPASTPTGIGIDVNRATSGSAENSTVMHGSGMMIFDFSTTDQGSGGPSCLNIQKQGNAGTSHPAVRIQGDNTLLKMVLPGTSSPPASNIIMSVGSVSVNKFVLKYSGELDINTTDLTGSIVITDTGTSGANLKMVGDGATTPNKTFRIKSGNLELLDSAYSAVILRVGDTGVLRMYNAILFNADNQVDIGSAGANRPRNVWAANALYTDGIVRAASTAVQLYGDNSGGVVRLTKAAGPITNPGADMGGLYLVAGTSGGTLKLVVRAGAAGAQTTILDNIPQ